MSGWVATVDRDRSLADAARLMAKAKTGSVVVTRKGKPVGIVTEGDVSRAVASKAEPSKLSVGKVASRKLVTTSPDARVEAAARVMAEKGIKKLPVVERGTLVGMVTQTDVVGSTFELVTSLKEMVRARYRPPDFEP